jgi:Signal recognition particle GTPase
VGRASSPKKRCRIAARSAPRIPRSRRQLQRDPRLREGRQEKALGSEVLNSVTPGQQIVKIIHDELVAVMGGETKEINLSGPAPVGIMMAGLQGSGKTTFAGKIASGCVAEKTQAAPRGS